MGLREKNRKSEVWGGEHPIQYAVVLSLALGTVQLIINAVFDRAFYWPTFLIWTLLFPTFSALIVRHRHNSRKTSL